jgi:hypothetical protein
MSEVARSKAWVRQPACWDCGFESRRLHGCLSVVNVVCCQVEVSVTGRSLVQRSPTECGVSLSVISCKNNPPHLQLLGRRVQTKKERKKERKNDSLKYIHTLQRLRLLTQFFAQYIMLHEVFTYLYLSN